MGDPAASVAVWPLAVHSSDFSTEVLDPQPEVVVIRVNVRRDFTGTDTDTEKTLGTADVRRRLFTRAVLIDVAVKKSHSLKRLEHTRVFPVIVKSLPTSPLIAATHSFRRSPSAGNLWKDNDVSVER